MLDVFSGTGAHSFEAISRGCTDVTSVEKHRGAAGFIRETSKELGVEEHHKIIQGDAFSFLESCHETYDFIFADPPFDLPTVVTIPNLVFQNNLLTINGLLVLEHSGIHNFSTNPSFKEERNYGTVRFSFFENPEE